jgi:Meckel syndrome type 1 protein
MDYKYKQLEQELSALSKVFSELGARLSEVAKEVTSPGLMPSEKVLEQISASRTSFENARTAIHAHAGAMLVSPLPKLGEIVSIAAIETLLKAAAVAEENKFSIEAEREKALTILQRVLSITHKESSEFKPLQECHAKLAELRSAISNVAWPHRHPDAETIVASKHPANALVSFVENVDTLDDEKWMALETTITESYGKPLFVAASRGKLAIPEAKPEPQPAVNKPVASAAAPAPAKPAVPAPEPPKQAVTAEKPLEKPAEKPVEKVEKKVATEKAPEKMTVPAPAPVPAAAPLAPAPVAVAAAVPPPSPAVSVEKKVAPAPPPAPIAAAPAAEKKEAVAEKAPAKPAAPVPVATVPATPAPAPEKVIAIEKKEVVEKPHVAPAIPVPAPAAAVSAPPPATVTPATPAAAVASAPTAPTSVVTAPTPVAPPAPPAVPAAAASIAPPAAPVATMPAAPPRPPAPVSSTPVVPAPPVPAYPVPTAPVAVGATNSAPAASQNVSSSLAALATATEPAVDKKPTVAAVVEVGDKQRKEPRLATPAPQQATKLETKAPELPQDDPQRAAAGDASQRPQRWGFWRGNR